ncbi:hypothetical protein ACTWP4_07540 [Gracilibacillus sp. D59]|uniref:hypothetical protein n=1 Tax=Gracilibacillus sp. D59 TaxID=3457434 RepID=UPI003FCECAAD
MEQGEIIVHAKYFSEIIRKLPSQTVQIEVEEHQTRQRYFLNFKLDWYAHYYYT